MVYGANKFATANCAKYLALGLLIQPRVAKRNGTNNILSGDILDIRPGESTFPLASALSRLRFAALKYRN